jgi:hypothetical protein
MNLSELAEYIRDEEKSEQVLHVTAVLCYFESRIVQR